MLSTNRKKLLNGFSLVELLIVISIIAVLLAVLIPALNKAREQARRVICRKNLQQIGIASLSYLGDYGHFPVWHDLGGGAYWIWDGRKQVSDEETPDNPMRGLVLNWINHGLLFSCKYLGTAKVYYCPTNEMVQFKYEDYFEGDKIKTSVINGTDKAGKRVRSSYMCRTYDVIGKYARRVHAEVHGTDISITNFLKRPDGKLAIIADTFTYGRGGHMKTIYNTLYGDGHVQAYDDRLKWVWKSAGWNPTLKNGEGDWDEAMKNQGRIEAIRRYGSAVVNGPTNSTADDARPVSWLFFDIR